MVLIKSYRFILNDTDYQGFFAIVVDNDAVVEAIVVDVDDAAVVESIVVRTIVIQMALIE